MIEISPAMDLQSVRLYRSHMLDTYDEIAWTGSNGWDYVAQLRETATGDLEWVVSCVIEESGPRVLEPIQSFPARHDMLRLIADGWSMEAPTIRTEDGKTVAVGACVYNYYDGWWGLVGDDIDTDGWFTLYGIDEYGILTGETACLNGERVSTYRPGWGSVTELNRADR